MTFTNGALFFVLGRVLKFYQRPLAEPLDFSCCIPDSARVQETHGFQTHPD